MNPHSDAIAVELVDHAIDMTRLDDFVADPDVGAKGWFCGVTRRTTGTQITRSLSYDAHRPMATTELLRLATDAVERFGLTRLVIVHRLGEVAVGQASIVIGCSSPHRKQTFAALPWLMDQIKTDVPIWKKEHFEGGATEWVHPTDS
ncbi:molybdopterin synthase catalytic subunit [Novipirellula artificiosorum]|uniref:Molybdopterin synthase catalytic subunit n=1 Tax=Novipirellula artificiosorum TaxID=2528016 RepID=A0A5C6DW02_9BACT|nr:molybdenum cofactor biosynthesis protein MoaE [Novipirellula artificiosorum]TWU39236.1 Molybdopterin synthase catalytic subunit [Novipirellula artificiosorum]